MGYRRPNKTINLRFAPGDELYGLEVQARGMDIGTYLQITGLDGGDGEGPGGAVQRFSEALIAWNLEEEDGTAVPATKEAFLRQDHDLILRLSGAWLDALNGVHKGDPLPESSPAGEPSPEVSIPMAPLSESLAS